MLIIIIPGLTKTIIRVFFIRDFFQPRYRFQIISRIFNNILDTGISEGLQNFYEWIIQCFVMKTFNPTTLRVWKVILSSFHRFAPKPSCFRRVYKIYKEFTLWSISFSGATGDRWPQTGVLHPVSPGEIMMLVLSGQSERDEHVPPYRPPLRVLRGQ